MATDSPERPKRRSRALEVLEAQNATEPDETDMTAEEFTLISGLMKRITDIPKTP